MPENGEYVAWSRELGITVRGRTREEARNKLADLMALVFEACAAGESMDEVLEKIRREEG